MIVFTARIEEKKIFICEECARRFIAETRYLIVLFGWALWVCRDCRLAHIGQRPKSAEEHLFSRYLWLYKQRPIKRANRRLFAHLCRYASLYLGVDVWVKDSGFYFYPHRRFLPNGSLERDDPVSISTLSCYDGDYYEGKRKPSAQLWDGGFYGWLR